MSKVYDAICISRTEIFNGIRQTIFLYQCSNFQFPEIENSQIISDSFKIQTKDYDFEAIWEIKRKIEYKYRIEEVGKSLRKYLCCVWNNIELLTFNKKFSNTLIVESMNNTENFNFHSDQGLNQKLFTSYSEIKKHMKITMIIIREDLSTEKIIKYYSKLNFKSNTIIFLVENSKIFASKEIVFSQCKVFETMYNFNWIEKNSNVITLPTCTKEIFEYILSFLYNGKLDIVDNIILLDIIKIAHLYEILDLVHICEYRLSLNLVIKNIEQVYIYSDRYKLIQLKNDCIKFILKNRKKIVFEKDFRLLSERFPHLLLELYQYSEIEEQLVTNYFESL